MGFILMYKLYFLLVSLLFSSIAESTKFEFAFHYDVYKTWHLPFVFVSCLGRIGPDCHRICDRFSPCHGGQCADSSNSEFGYSCKCDSNHTGRYCTESVQLSCPASWWSSPICGPCNCPKQKGFDPNCNKVTGQCSCRVRVFL